MKQYLLIILHFTTFVLYAQEWAPIGATWHYDRRASMSSHVSYAKLTVVGDTMINEKKCKVLNHNGGLTCLYSPSTTFTEFIYEQDSVVYYYDYSLDEFQTLYNFNTKKNESWIVRMKNHSANTIDTCIVIVDSIGYINVNAKELKTLFLTYKLNFENVLTIVNSSVAVYLIGDVSEYFFNLRDQSFFVCDGDWGYGLRCYQDNYIGYYKTELPDSCDYIVGITKENSISNSMSIYPNPIFDKITINCSEKENNSYVYNLLGELVVQRQLVKGINEIDISNMQNGIYVIKIENELGTIQQKLIKK